MLISNVALIMGKPLILENPKTIHKMKLLLTNLLLAIFTFQAQAQAYQTMAENEPLENETLKASYNAQFVKNRKTQDVYDIKFSMKNHGYDLIKFKNNIGETEYDLSDYWLAKLNFSNATGSNLTLREGFLQGDEFFQRVTFKCGEKEQSERMLLGYGIERGKTLSSTYRIRVPVGEKPVVEIQFVNYN